MKNTNSDSSKLRINVIIGTTREGRFGDKPGEWIYNHLQKEDGVEAVLVDLRDYPLPFFNDPVSPAYAQEPSKDVQIARWAKSVASADAYVIIAAEYNHGYPAVLKNALDCVYREWNNKAVGFVGYGSVSGARSIEQLRQVAIELQMAPIRNSVQMPYKAILDVSAIKEGDKLAPLAEYNSQVKGFIDQLVWWGAALKKARV